MPLVAALLPGGFPLIAWGKPVQTNPRNYTDKLPRKVGRMLVSLAGPAMNLILALVVSIVFVLLGRAGKLSPAVADVLVRYVIALNLILMFFNLIPLPPLDGAAVLAGVLPESLQKVPLTLEKYGSILFFILFLSGALGFVMAPAYRVIGPGRAPWRGSWRHERRARRLSRRPAGVRRAAGSAAASLQDARDRHRQHPDRVHHREVPRVSGRDAVDAVRRGGRLPGDGGDAGLSQVARAGPDARASGGRRRRRGRRGAGPARRADPATARVPEIQECGRAAGEPPHRGTDGLRTRRARWSRPWKRR